ncbi:MAG: class I SAM-dependent methyltransferase [Fulvivirga sp.]
MSKIHRVTSYLSYWLNAVNEHSLHAPFIYDLYKKVLKKPVAPDAINEVRKRLENSNHQVNVNGYGAGSEVDNGSMRNVSDIAKYGITKHKYAQLLERLIEYLESENILELGTSLGVNTLYLSKNQNSKVITIEGEESLMNIAESVFEAQNRTNIDAVCGKIDDILPEVIQNQHKLDFVFFDANHTKKATLNYFSQCLKRVHDKTCFVFDDIHWSTEMEEAWDRIKKHYEVTLSIDIYQMGIVFFNPEIRKQDYILEY